MHDTEMNDNDGESSRPKMGMDGLTYRCALQHLALGLIFSMLVAWIPPMARQLVMSNSVARRAIPLQAVSATGTVELNHELWQVTVHARWSSDAVLLFKRFAAASHEQNATMVLPAWFETSMPLDEAHVTTVIGQGWPWRCFVGQTVVATGNGRTVTHHASGSILVLAGANLCTGVLWAPLAMNSVVLGLTCGVLHRVALQLRAWHRRRTNLCEKCGFPAAPASPWRCPECGHAATGRGDRPRRREMSRRQCERNESV